ncbi:MAG: ATP-binding protein [Elusimicrobiota bacterium]
MMLIGLLPVAFLLLAASMLVVSQIAGFFQFNRHLVRERDNRFIIQRFINEVTLAHTQLGRRSRELMTLSHRLKANNEELSRLNNLKSKFLSMVVHDVRTPLASIKGYSEMLMMRGKLDDQQKKFVSFISRGGDQINRLVSDLTDLAVIEAGKLRMEMSGFELAALVGEVVPSIRLLTAKKGIAFGESAVPESVAMNGDRGRLAQVLTNLLGNAVKFTPPGGSVDFGVRLLGSSAFFTMRDSGPGIHPSERRLIFEKFYQSRHSNPKAMAQGWGLGLAISTEIVRRHGGQIGVESPGLGHGSTFWVKVPLIAAKVRQPLARLALALGLLLAWPAAGRAQTLPLEEKAKFERSQEERVEAVLLKILGPNRSKVIVEATVDFTRIEIFEAKDGAATARTVKNVPYLWGSSPEAGSGGGELLPGIPVPETPVAATAREPQSYERRNTYPDKFLKRLAVTLILDRTITPVQTEEIRGIVGELLEIDPDRGDILTVVHTSFSPIWKSVWYAPETAGLVIKYALVSLISLMTLVVVAACFLRLAGAMSAMARSQSQQLSMEMRSAAGMPGKEELGLPEGEGGPEKEGAANAEAEAKKEVVFEVGLEQVEPLAEMMASENPANIAIVAERLKPEVRQALLAAFKPELTQEVIVELGHVRFIDPDVILNLKEELERRLAGAVGGVSRIVEMVKAADMAERQRLIEGLMARDEALAREVRGRVFLIEDLCGLSREEWSALQGRIPHQDWAAALAGGSGKVAECLKATMPAGAWNVLEQMLAAGGAEPPERRAAEGRIAAAVEALVAQGKLAPICGRGLAMAGPEPRSLSEAGSPENRDVREA